MTDVEYAPLGVSGLAVSRIGLGCNNFGRSCDQAQTQAVVDAALGAGINFFDTADSYSIGASETMLGHALKRRRDEVVLATKFGFDMGGANGADHGARGSRRYVMRALEASLTRLQTDYIDLYQYHFPDHVTPIDETLSALDDLVRQGKVRYIGSSNMAAWEIVDAAWSAKQAGTAVFVSTQAQYNLLHRSPEVELIAAAARAGSGVIPWYPLASGLLTGKYRFGAAAPAGARLADKVESFSAAVFDRLEALGKYAAARGVTLLDVAISGLLAQPGVTSVIAGATRPDQVHGNVAAATWRPSGDDLLELDAIAPRGVDVV